MNWPTMHQAEAGCELCGTIIQDPVLSGQRYLAVLHQPMTLRRA